MGEGADRRARAGSGWARGGGTAVVAAELGRRAAGPREAGCAEELGQQLVGPAGG